MSDCLFWVTAGAESEAAATAGIAPFSGALVDYGCVTAACWPELEVEARLKLASAATAATAP